MKESTYVFLHINKRTIAAFSQRVEDGPQQHVLSFSTEMTFSGLIFFINFHLQSWAPGGEAVMSPYFVHNMGTYLSKLRILDPACTVGITGLLKNK